MDWIRVSTSGGVPNENASVALGYNVLYNDSADKRSGSITISSGGKDISVSIVQEERHFLETDSQSLFLNETAQEISIRVQSNVNYDVEIEGDWISRSDTKALTTDVLTFSVSENPSLNKRKGCITLSGEAGGLHTPISIEQKGAPILLANNAYGIYNSDKGLVLHTNSSTQYGMLESDDSIEFHLVNAPERTFCLFTGITPDVRSKQVGDEFTASVETNSLKFSDYEFDLSLRILKLEDGVVWAWDAESGMGIIFRAGRP